jgi:hypothetical protein
VLTAVLTIAAVALLVAGLPDRASAQYQIGSAQDARVLPAGAVEVAVSSIVYPRVSDGGRTIDLTGGGVTLGIVSRADIGLGATYRHYLGVSNTLVFLQPRFSLVADRLAIAAPISVDLGARFDRSGNRYNRGDVSVSPTLIGSLPLSRSLDVTGSLRSVMGTCCPAGRAVMAAEGGPTFHTPDDRVAVRAAFGRLFSARGGLGGWTVATTVAVRAGRASETNPSDQSAR